MSKSRRCKVWNTLNRQKKEPKKIRGRTEKKHIAIMALNCHDIFFQYITDISLGVHARQKGRRIIVSLHT